ncbi:MAG: cytochrome c [Opitutales bacterium]
MKADLQSDSRGRVPSPPDKRFLMNLSVMLVAAGTLMLALSLRALGAGTVLGEEDASPAGDRGADHAGLIEGWDDSALERGREVYQQACIACHGADGRSEGTQALAFSADTFLSGADPYSMYRTLTEGYETMPAMTWLTPQQRYNVIHYIRETFIREQNPDEYVEVDEDYLASLPEAEPEAAARRRGEHQFGGALNWRLGSELRSGLTLDLGDDVTIIYDLHRMRLAGAWSGGFLRLVTR